MNKNTNQKWVIQKTRKNRSRKAPLRTVYTGLRTKVPKGYKIVTPSY